MKKILLLLLFIIGVSCTTDIQEEIVTADIRGLVDGTSGVNCDAFIYPSDIEFYTPYKTTEKISALEVVLNELNGVWNPVYFRWYPKNGKYQAFLSISNLSGNRLYGTDVDGNIIIYDLGDDIFRIRITGNNYSEEFCFNPTSNVTAIYISEKKFPDGEYEVEFLDYHTQYGVSNYKFNKPSF